MEKQSGAKVYKLVINNKQNKHNKINKLDGKTQSPPTLNQASVVSISNQKEKEKINQAQYQKIEILAARKVFNSIIDYSYDGILNFSSEYNKLTNIFMKISPKNIKKEHSTRLNYIDQNLKNYILMGPKNIPNEILIRCYQDKDKINCVDISFESIKKALLPSSKNTIITNLDIINNTTEPDQVSAILLYDLYKMHSKTLDIRLHAINLPEVLKFGPEQAALALNKLDIGINCLKLRQDYLLTITGLKCKDFEQYTQTTYKKLNQEYITATQQITELLLVKSAFLRAQQK